MRSSRTCRASRDDQVFVRALTELARNFGIEIVAEWVQDEETAAMLADWGVDYIQGILLGEAVTDWPPAKAPAGLAEEARSVEAGQPVR